MKRTLIAAGMIGSLASSTVSTAQEGSVSTIVPDIRASGDIAIGPDGRLHLADFGASLQSAGGRNIYRIANDGSSTEVLSDEFGGASGNEFGDDGHLYQSDVGRGEVWRIDGTGTRIRLADGLTSPVGITHGPDGHTYVTECLANAITRIGADGSTERIAEGSPLVCPNGLTHGPDGNLYTVNFRDGSMVRIEPGSGATSVVTTIPGGGNGHLAWANDRFYVASFRGNRIYSVTMSGAICLIAGSGEAGNRDGGLLSATFFRPNGIAISPDGNTLFTNTVTAIVASDDPTLHPNAVRRVDGLLALLDCPAEREAGSAGGS